MLSSHIFNQCIDTILVYEGSSTPYLYVNVCSYTPYIYAKVVLLPSSMCKGCSSFYFYVQVVLLLTSIKRLINSLLITPQQLKARRKETKLKPNAKKQGIQLGQRRI